MHELGRWLVILGAVLLFGPKLPFPGKLPGDIVIKREHVTFYFPLASIVISLLISLILSLIGRSR